MLRRRSYLSEAKKQATVELFLLVLTSKIIQADKRSMRGKYYNPNALGLLLGVANDLKRKLSSVKGSSDPSDLKNLKKLLSTEFTSDYSPARFVIRSIDKYLATGAMPKLT